MTPEDWERLRAGRPNWREADLHDLRIRFAALLLDVAEHRVAAGGVPRNDADRSLWSALDREG